MRMTARHPLHAGLAPDRVDVLFVDDEQMVLDGLRRMLFPLRNQWRLRFACSGADALEALAQEPADVVVSDMRMPGMDGATLLQLVADRHPGTVRIILSGQSEREAALRSVGPCHSFIAKPCSSQELTGIINRAMILRRMLTSPGLQRMVAGMRVVPTLPEAVKVLVAEMQKPDPSLHRLADIIATDPVLAAKVLQISNSAFFGNRQTFTRVSQAVQYLGLEVIKAILLGAGIFAQFDATLLARFSFNRLWQHSLRTAHLARQIALILDLGEQLADESYTAGLLHDIGTILLAANQPAVYARLTQELKRTGRPRAELEVEAFGASQALVGGYLLGLWGLQDRVVEAVAFHPTPRAIPDALSSPMVMVHVAGWLADTVEGGDFCFAANGRLDPTIVNHLRIEERLPQWLALAGQEAHGALAV